jgi:hypothetical protein
MFILSKHFFHFVPYSSNLSLREEEPNEYHVNLKFPSGYVPTICYCHSPHTNAFVAMAPVTFPYFETEFVFALTHFHFHTSEEKYVQAVI